MLSEKEVSTGKVSEEDKVASRVGSRPLRPSME